MNTSMSRTTTAVPLATAFVLALAATGRAQTSGTNWSNGATPKARLDEAAPDASAYSALHVGNVSTDLRSDVLTLQGGELALWISPGRYFYRHEFPDTCTGAALVPSASPGRSAVLCATADGLQRYDCTHGSIGTKVPIDGSDVWAGASALDARTFGDTTYVAGRAADGTLLVSILDGTRMQSPVVVAAAGTILDLCLLDWDGDEKPEVAAVASGGLVVFDASGSLLLFVPGTALVGRVARLPLDGRDDLLFAAREPVSGACFLFAIHGVVSGTNVPHFDGPFLAPGTDVSDLVVADCDGDGLDDAVLADGLAEGGQAWVMHQFSDESAGLWGFLFDVGPAGRVNHFVFEEDSALAASLALAAGDYDSDGDVDIAGGLVVGDAVVGRTRTTWLLPSTAVDERPLRARFMAYTSSLTLAGSDLSCTYSLDFDLPPLTSNPRGWNEMQIAIWMQRPPSAGGAVDAVAKTVIHRAVGSADWGTSITVAMPSFTRPNDAAVVHQIQYTFLKRSGAGAIVDTGPSWTGYHNASVVPAGNVILGVNTHPDEPPGGITQNPNIRPPNNPPSP